MSIISSETTKTVSVEPTPRLRFVEREAHGKRILQQLWSVTTYEGAKAVRGGTEWRDVPLEPEVL